MEVKINPQKDLEALSLEKGTFKTLFERGLLSVEVYQPTKVDLRQPNDKNEVYLVILGVSEFLNDLKRMNLSLGDFLFVTVGVAHRFENFIKDFSCRLFFNGSNGSEIP